ncbi:MAG: hypothetical protein AAFV47_12335 [Pseudomonadota bacterium]
MKKLLIPLVVGIAVVIAAVAVSDDEAPLEGILLSFEAATDAEGNCTPKRFDRAMIGDSNLYAVRGDTQYIMPTGTTSIPFQIVFRSTDMDGTSTSDTISMLNHPGSCSELTIKIEIDHCEYLMPEGREERACPVIRTEGIAAFQAVTVKN